jgi:hypothetical protein
LFNEQVWVNKFHSLERCHGQTWSEAASCSGATHWNDAIKLSLLQDFLVFLDSHSELAWSHTYNAQALPCVSVLWLSLWTKGYDVLHLASHCHFVLESHVSKFLTASLLVFLFVRFRQSLSQFRLLRSDNLIKSLKNPLAQLLSLVPIRTWSTCVNPCCKCCLCGQHSDHLHLEFRRCAHGKINLLYVSPVQLCSSCGHSIEHFLLLAEHLNIACRNAAQLDYASSCCN